MDGPNQHLLRWGEIQAILKTNLTTLPTHPTSTYQRPELPYQLDLDERVDPPPIVTCIDMLVRASVSNIDPSEDIGSSRTLRRLVDLADIVWTYSFWMIKHGYDIFGCTERMASDFVVELWKDICEAESSEIDVSR